DTMMVIDSQYENFRVMKPLVQAREQYQEYALVIVSTSEEGKVLGSKTFSYDAVARSGDIQAFDQLIDRGYRSMISDSPDVGVMSEAIQEIARYTSDEFPAYMGKKGDKAVLSSSSAVSTEPDVVPVVTGPTSTIQTLTPAIVPPVMTPVMTTPPMMPLSMAPAVDQKDFTQTAARSESASTTFVPAEVDTKTMLQRVRGLATSSNRLPMLLATDKQFASMTETLAQEDAPTYEVKQEGGRLVVLDVKTNTPVKVSSLSEKSVLIARESFNVTPGDAEAEALAIRIGLAPEADARQQQIFSSIPQSQFADRAPAPLSIAHFAIAAVKNNAAQMTTQSQSQITPATSTGNAGQQLQLPTLDRATLSATATPPVNLPIQTGQPRLSRTNISTSLVTNRQVFEAEFARDANMRIGVAVISPAQQGQAELGEVGGELQRILMPTIASTIAETASS
ncbi:MAG: hypothetical protein K8I60_02140, partial [Anaerolineae bacterium]|nr:hypothetical protein [Anaerolineae bacterium]